MRGPHWTEVGVTTVLLLGEMVTGQLCKSPIIVLDGFHTLFMLLNTLYNSILSFYRENPLDPRSASPSSHVCVDYRAMRAQPVGTFISNLFLLSINTIYITELCSFVLEPVVVRRPLLLVATGAFSLTFKMFLLGLQWPHEQRGQRDLTGDSHIEINHNALIEEETAQTEQGGALNNNKPKGCESSLHNAALTISNPNTVNISEDVTEHHTNGTCRQHSNSTNPTTVQPPLEKPVAHSLFSSWLHIGETLLTPCLVLVNGLVTLSVGFTWLHNSNGLLVYLDSMLSFLAVVLLIANTVPLVFRHGQLLVQCAPRHLSVEEVGQKIVDIPGVEAMHELHVWKLTELFVVASVHVQCCASLQNRCADVVLEVTKVFQSVGVTCSTIQPEFTEVATSSRPCSLACGEACAGHMCCSHLEQQYKILMTVRTDEEP
ncbi:proton-coupled zinc antiporter SLC30A1 [Eucyclogobius newberryi]|uniref:proton-coupled zinc antiporter SLC30A1 n=1 Tax=Eucyclogobius newberryi TaxID=166745 RepID=UPI003B5B24FC